MTEEQTPVTNGNGDEQNDVISRHKKRHQRGVKDELVPLRHIDLSACKTVNDVISAMSFTAFGGRTLGESADVLEQMFSDTKCFRVLTISGAMTVAKMGLIFADLIDRGFVNAVVCTGALMSHGFIESAGMQHVKDPGLSDEELYKLGYDRVYDTLESEANFDQAAEIFDNVLRAHDASVPLSSADIVFLLGKYVQDNILGRSMLKSAFVNNVPIFIPAFSDSELGLDFAAFNRRMKMEGKKELVFDPMKDLEAYTELVFNSECMGIFTIGGGVPRNWAQQVGPYLDLIRCRLLGRDHFSNSKKDPYIKKFKYAVRVCPEPTNLGGLSGCTYSEGVSWGKFVSPKKGGRFAEVPCDATIALPFIVKAVFERLDAKKELSS